MNRRIDIEPSVVIASPRSSVRCRRDGERALADEGVGVGVLDDREVAVLVDLGPGTVRRGHHPGGLVVDHHAEVRVAAVAGEEQPNPAVREQGMSEPPLEAGVVLDPLHDRRVEADAGVEGEVPAVHRAQADAVHPPARQRLEVARAHDRGRRGGRACGRTRWWIRREAIATAHSVRERVDDLVERAVAAEHRHAVRTLGDRLGGQVGGVVAAIRLLGDAPRGSAGPRFDHLHPGRGSRWSPSDSPPTDAHPQEVSQTSADFADQRVARGQTRTHERRRLCQADPGPRRPGCAGSQHQDPEA